MDVKGSLGIQQRMWKDTMKQGMIDFKVKASNFLCEEIKQEM